MVTDDERREVAERLRRAWANVPDKNPVRHHMRVLYEIYAAVGLNDGGDDAIDLFARLADLIYPGDMLYVTYSRSTCGPDGMAYMVKVRHRARGLERDFYAVDLKKLLEVLDEMDITVKCAGPDVPRDYVENWANEVREALGASGDE